MRWVHPSLVANTQGTGMGGMTSMQTMYHDNLLGRSKPNDILQEALPNVIAAHVVQSYLGSYGAMIHPVGACATAAVSIEEGVDKIRLGKAELVVAGGFDDLTHRGHHRLRRHGGHRRHRRDARQGHQRLEVLAGQRPASPAGSSKSQGGGTILLARGDLALKMGLPVLGCGRLRAVASPTACTRRSRHRASARWAPAAAAMTPLLATLAGEAGCGCRRHRGGLQARHLDAGQRPQRDRAARAARRLAGPVGRRPLFVVSQKSLTGHAKGGAAAFQMIGLCQMLRDGVDPAEPQPGLRRRRDGRARPTSYGRGETLRLGDKYPLKAGLVTSLGFGHVSALIAVVHPQAFLAALDPEQRETYTKKATERSLAGQRRLASAIAGGRPMYERPADRRFGHEMPEKPQEAAMLLDAASRLGEHGHYTR